MSLLVLDRDIARELRADRKARGIDQHDEVWEGIYVMSPIADIEHQAIVLGLGAAFFEAIDRAGLGHTYPGVNVSDRVERWRKNFRTPDVVVILHGSKAENHRTFWSGAIDFAVEVVSRGDRSQKKLPFYSKIGLRELLLVHRHPWRLKLYRHDGQKLKLAGTSEIETATNLDSEVLPFSFRLVDSAERPMIELTHRPDGRTWQA